MLKDNDSIYFKNKRLVFQSGWCCKRIRFQIRCLSGKKLRYFPLSPLIRRLFDLRSSATKYSKFFSSTEVLFFPVSLRHRSIGLLFDSTVYFHRCDLLPSSYIHFVRSQPSSTVDLESIDHSFSVSDRSFLVTCSSERTIPDCGNHLTSILVTSKWKDFYDLGNS